VRAEKTLARLGGTATRRELRLAGVHWRHLGAALDAGRVVRSSRGHYRVPGGDAATAAAHRLCGATSHTSAALHWGWKVRTVPDRPHVTIRRKRSLPRGAADGVTLHWRDLDADDLEGSVTGRVRTVIDCCLDLPLDEALSAVDSARRDGVRVEDVTRRAAWLAPRQRGRVERVLALSDPRAANPFESALRAIALQVAGLRVVPQTRIRYDDFAARVDLADEALRIVLEADSHAFHTGRRAFDRDCRRYNGLVVRDWVVLRFTWEQVMLEPDTVLRAVEAAVELRRTQGIRRDRRGRPAGTNPRWALLQP
jgi:very-short-patch-repair endonuclease